MGIGVIILLPSQHAGAGVRTLLGVPVAIRALGATLLPREPVQAVLVGPAEQHAVLRAQAERFGLTELSHTIPPAASEVASIRAALQLLDRAHDVVVVQHGLHALTPVALTARVVEAAREHQAAVGVLPVVGTAYPSGETLGAPVAEALAVPQWPAAFTRDALESLVAPPLEGLLMPAAARRSGGVRTVAGDRDLFPVEEDADLTRALEVWGRRAPEYAFLWPRPEPGVEEQTTVHSLDALNLTIPDAPGEGS